MRITCFVNLFVDRVKMKMCRYSTYMLLGVVKNASFAQKIAFFGAPWAFKILKTPAGAGVFPGAERRWRREFASGARKFWGKNNRNGGS